MHECTGTTTTTTNTIRAAVCIHRAAFQIKFDNILRPEAVLVIMWENYNGIIILMYTSFSLDIEY